jgi:20S proteasome subunit beta 3
MEYNGSAVVAMAGKNCVAIAADTRFGIQHQTVATDMKKIFPVGETTMVAMTGLISDVQTLIHKFKFRQNLYELREGRPMKARVFSNMVSSLLYERRFGPYFMEPVIVGLEEASEPACSPSPSGPPPAAAAAAAAAASAEKTTAGAGEKPSKQYRAYLCGMDLLGAPVYTDNFMVAGTTSDQLHGCCEAMFRPDMEPEDLFETISQVLLAAQDRDCLAGWGAVVHVITPEGVITRELKARVD